MADLARASPQVAAADRGLLHAAAAILAMAFLDQGRRVAAELLAGAGLQRGHVRPWARVFAIMTKVGIYAMLRLWTLMFAAEAGASAQFGSAWLVGGGLATMVVRRRRHARHAAARRTWRATRAWCRPASCWRPSAWGRTCITAGAAVLPAQLHAGRERAVPADRHDRPLAQRRRQHRAVRAERRRCAVPDRRTWCPPKACNLDDDEEVLVRPRHSRRPWPSWAWLHGLHPADDRPAAAVGLRRQVRHADGRAQPAGPGHIGRPAARLAGWAFVALLIASGCWR